MAIRKNIISISGRDRVGVRNELKRFMDAFKERQSDANIEIIRFEENINFHNLEQMILSVGLFAEKRLFILKGSFFEKTEKKGKEKKEENRSDSLIKILEQIDDETFIIIVFEGDIGGGFEKWTKENADMRVFDSIFSAQIWEKRYPQLSLEILKKVLDTYERIYALYDEDKKPRSIATLIEESLEKLSLLSQTTRIGEEDISLSILIESSGRIFDLTDAILSGNVKKSLQLFHTLEGESTMYQFLPSFIGLLRGSVYVKYMKYHGYSEPEIIQSLKLHPFVVKKAFQSSVNWESLRDFYDKIVSINIAYRSGKGLHDPELGRIFGIERAIMSLKK
ncbi:MAG: DNA polymerase III subunit delta [Candidatus Altimarinota bacterium]